MSPKRIFAKLAFRKVFFHVWYWLTCPFSDSQNQGGPEGGFPSTTKEPIFYHIDPLRIFCRLTFQHFEHVAQKKSIANPGVFHAAFEAVLADLY